jgi:hypothetical protein
MFCILLSCCIVPAPSQLGAVLVFASLPACCMCLHHRNLERGTGFTSLPACCLVPAPSQLGAGHWLCILARMLHCACTIATWSGALVVHPCLHAALCLHHRNLERGSGFASLPACCIVPAPSQLGAGHWFCILPACCMISACGWCPLSPVRFRCRPYALCATAGWHRPASGRLQKSRPGAAQVGSHQLGQQRWHTVADPVPTPCLFFNAFFICC